MEDTEKEVSVSYKDVDKITFYHYNNGFWVTYAYVRIKGKDYYFNFKATRHLLRSLGLSFKRIRRKAVDERNKIINDKLKEKKGKFKMLIGKDTKGRDVVRDIEY